VRDEKAVVGSYSRMSSSADHVREQARECCLNAVLADDIDRGTHWLEAAARWLALGRPEGVLTQPKVTSVTTRPDTVPTAPRDTEART
jgi:hypothetical protein